MPSRPHTCVQSAAQKVEPHGDVVIPVQGVDSDTFSNDWAVKIVSYYGVFICISNKNLKGNMLQIVLNKVKVHKKCIFYINLKQIINFFKNLNIGNAHRN